MASSTRRPAGAAGPELRSSAAHVFVPDVERPVLEDTDHHHLSRVLRLRPGEVVTVSDGRGSWRPCAWAGLRAGSALDVIGAVVREDRATPEVAVGFALTKGRTSDWVVQKLTEAGVDRLSPVAAARSIVRWDGPAAAGHVERWERLVREAAMQSRRVWLPRVDGLATFDEAVPGLGAAAALAEPGGEPPSLTRPAILVGPEGGWAPEELACGLPLVALGTEILRSDTAAVAAGILLCALRARLVG